MATIDQRAASALRTQVAFRRSQQNRIAQFGRDSLRVVGRDPLAIFGLVITAMVVVVTIFAPLIATHDPNQIDLSAKLTAPNSEYWFGTDETGRDLFSRVVHGCRLSITTGFVILIVTALIGATLGGVAGYLGGTIDEIIMRVSDFFMAFPYLILAMAIAFSLGASMQNAIFAIIVVFWPSYARIVRGQVTSLRHREFVESARVSGATGWRIMMRHILPQTWTSLTIKFSLDMGFAIVALASLGFIGLGAQPPTAEWGTIIAQSRLFAIDHWWYGVLPGLTITVTVIGFNLLGDTIQEIIEPTLRR